MSQKGCTEMSLRSFRIVKMSCFNQIFRIDAQANCQVYHLHVLEVLENILVPKQPLLSVKIRMKHQAINY
jgi:hypothetical protein